MERPSSRFFNRVKQVYEDIRQQDCQQIFVVSHSGVIRAFLCLLEGISLKNAFDAPLEFGVVFKIDEVNQVNQLK